MTTRMRMRTCLSGAAAGAALMLAGAASANDDCVDAISVALGDVVAGSTAAATFDGYLDECTACAGDTNCDGIIDYTDLLNVFQNFGTSGPLGDVNFDGVVNLLDCYLVAWNYGKGLPLTRHE